MKISRPLTDRGGHAVKIPPSRRQRPAPVLRRDVPARRPRWRTAVVDSSKGKRRRSRCAQLGVRRGLRVERLARTRFVRIAGRLRCHPPADRIVEVVPDGDYQDNPNVRRAITRLGEALAARGARPRAVILPSGASSMKPEAAAKVGADDFVASGRGSDDIEALQREELAPALVRQGLDLGLFWPSGVRFAADSDSRRPRRRAGRADRDAGRSAALLGRSRCPAPWRARGCGRSSRPSRQACRGATTSRKLPGGFTQAAREGEPLVAVDRPGRRRRASSCRGCSTKGSRRWSTRTATLASPLRADGRRRASTPGHAAARPHRPARSRSPISIGRRAADTIESRLALLAAGLGIDPPTILIQAHDPPARGRSRCARGRVRPARRRPRDRRLQDVRRRGRRRRPHSMSPSPRSTGRSASSPRRLARARTTSRMPTPAAGAPARPFGGAFAFNGPRADLGGQARPERRPTRRPSCSPAGRPTTCPRGPTPSGSGSSPGEGTITVFPSTLRRPPRRRSRPRAWLSTQARPAGGRPGRTVEVLAEAVGAAEDSVRRTLNRSRDKGGSLPSPAPSPQQWALRSQR